MSRAGQAGMTPAELGEAAARSENLARLVCECKRCGHRWIPRGAALPQACPRCQSRKWNVPSGEHAPADSSEEG